MDVDALKALILSQQQQLLSKDEQLLSRDHEIEHLKLLIAKLQRMQFGRKSEKVERQIEQLTLKLEELETSRAEHEQAQESTPAPSTPREASAKRRPSRRPLPAHLLRVTKVHEPAQQACPLSHSSESLNSIYTMTLWKVENLIRASLSGLTFSLDSASVMDRDKRVWSDCRR
jgi:chromosome segregation ATPase